MRSVLLVPLSSKDLENTPWIPAPIALFTVFFHPGISSPFFLPKIYIFIRQDSALISIPWNGLGWDISQMLPPLNSCSSQCLDQPSGIQPRIILSLAAFSCTHPESQLDVPLRTIISTCLLLGFLLHFRSAFSTTCCLIGIPNSTWENPNSPFFPLRKLTRPTILPSQRVACIYSTNTRLFNKYWCLLWARH